MTGAVGSRMDSGRMDGLGDKTSSKGLGAFAHPPYQRFVLPETVSEVYREPPLVLFCCHSLALSTDHR